MSIKKPVPEVVSSSGRRCPVCGKVSYSRFGTHPQCASDQADEKIRQRLRRQRGSRG